MSFLKVSKTEVAAGLLTLAGVVAVVLDHDVLPPDWRKVLTVLGAIVLYITRSPLLGGPR